MSIQICGAKKEERKSKAKRTEKGTGGKKKEIVKRNKRTRTLGIVSV